MSEPAAASFANGLVFGFDVGTEYIGWAVRRGQEFPAWGVIGVIGDGDLKQRRDLRRMRRTVRARQYRLRWLIRQLERLGFPSPLAHQGFQPIELRAKAVSGEALTREQLAVALYHLFHHRGFEYSVPWGKSEDAQAKKKREDDAATSKQIETLPEGCQYPCELLAKRLNSGESTRKHAFRRHLIEKEYRRIVETQRAHFPELVQTFDWSRNKPWHEWVLFGDSKLYDHGIAAFRRRSVADRGVFGVMWPRFDNRGPGLDLYQPFDEHGKPHHTVRRAKQAYRLHQFEVAIRNFRVIDRTTQRTVEPPAEFIQLLRRHFFTKSGKPKAIKLDTLKMLAAPFADRFTIAPWQNNLTPEKGAGHSRFSTPTLKFFGQEVAAGRLPADNPQPLLQRIGVGETTNQAITRLIGEVAFPIARHRLEILNRLLDKLIGVHGKPNFIVIEAIRGLALGKDAEEELKDRQKRNTEERASAATFLREQGIAITYDNILKYRLWRESDGRCPYCLTLIGQGDFRNLELEHIVPQRTIVCNEFFNQTIAHHDCNREKNGRTPFEAFGQADRWHRMCRHAEEWFKNPLKYQLFTSPTAEDLLLEKRGGALTQTAYIARLLRQLCLVKCGWLTAAGRDATTEAGSISSRVMTSNGATTALLRRSWGLGAVLGRPAGDDERAKNRDDIRNHALDALVIACTWPPAALRVAQQSRDENAYWRKEAGGKAEALNRFGLNYEKAVALLPSCDIDYPHLHKRHAKHYDTTFLGKRGADDAPVFVVRTPVGKLTVKHITKLDLHPRPFGEYVATAFQRHQADGFAPPGDKKQLPTYMERFFERLCFSHFQYWKEKRPPFSWPANVKIPIQNVRLIKTDQPDTVMGLRTKPDGQRKDFVERTEFKEARVYRNANGEERIVYLPHWKTDQLYQQALASVPAPDWVPGPSFSANRVIALADPVDGTAIVPPGKYRITSLSTQNDRLFLIPVELNTTDKAILAKATGKSSGPYTISVLEAVQRLTV